MIQILFGLLRAGRLADFFPLTPVHGMLASIGIIIIAKQAYEVLGATPETGAGPLELLAELPAAVRPDSTPRSRSSGSSACSSCSACR